MLEKEYEFFKKNLSEFKRKYLGKFIVIKDEQVIGVYSKSTDALQETLKSHKIGTFLIQQVLEKEEDYIQRFHSRVFV